MKHILSNPHNGSPIDHEGVKLEPGHELHVRPEVAKSLTGRFAFLLHRIVPGAETPAKKNKPVKLKTPLNWHPHNHGTDEVPEPDSVNHVVTEKSARKPAAKKSGKKK